MNFVRFHFGSPDSRRVSAVPILALGAALAAAPVSGQVAPAPTSEAAAITLDEVTVKGQALRGANAPFSTEAFDTATIRDLRVTQPQELFRHVPGMNVRNLGLPGVADNFVLRGFGGGGHGGDLGAVIDGIPLNEAMSHADGYVDFNVVVPLEIAAMTVYKGPVSALYGNYNRSGLIALETRKEGDYRSFDISGGSHGTFEAQTALGLPVGTGQQVNLAAQFYRSDGFRPQTKFDRGTVAGRWSFELSPTMQLALSGRAYYSEGDSASYLTRAQFDTDPYGIDPRVQNDGAEKDFGNLRADFSLKLNDELKLLAFAYNTHQSFTRWFTRPVSPTAWAQREESYDRDVFGAGVNLNGQHGLTGGMLNWIAGVETFRESTRYLFNDNLARRQRVSPTIYDRTADLDSTSLFGELEAPLHPMFKPWIGVRHDRFDGGATRNGPETGADPLGPMNRINHTSPKFGVRSDLAPGVRLRASWAEGYALPSNFVKYASGASNLDPNTFRQTEVGATFRAGGTLVLDLAAYRIQSSDEFRTVGPGVYENFGETKRTGFEAKLDWTPREALSFTLVYGTADSEVEENANAALIGKEVTGVSDGTGTLTVAWAPRTGWGASTTLRYVGPYAVDAANIVYSPSYTTVDATLSYSGVLEGRRRYRVYAGVDNVFDRVYATSVSIIGGSQLFAAGAPLTVKAGVQFDF